MLATRVVVAACELEGAPEVVAFSVEVCGTLVVSATVEVCGTVEESMWLVLCALLLLSNTDVVSCPEVEAARVVCFIVDG